MYYTLAMKASAAYYKRLEASDAPKYESHTVGWALPIDEGLPGVLRGMAGVIAAVLGVDIHEPPDSGYCQDERQLAHGSLCIKSFSVPLRLF